MLNPNAILLPLFAMFTLACVVAGNLLATRIQAVRARKVHPDYFKNFTGGESTPEMTVATRHYSNLFEMPVFFYAVVILIFMTGHVDKAAVILAWIYVILRYVHSIIHLGRNAVTPRLLAFAASNTVLAILWIKLAVGLYF